MPEAARPEEPWVLFVDGASSKEGSGTGLLLTSPTGEELTYALRFDFPASNNEAEYEALLTGLRIAHQMGITAIRVRSDSQLVVYQVRGEYEAKEDVMKKYLAKAQEAIKLFDIFEIERVPRSQNKRVDALSKLASSSFAHLSKEVLVEVVKQKNIDPVRVLAIDSPATWMTPLLDFLSSGVLPKDKIEARRLQLRAAKYAYAGNTLYRMSYLSPWLKCVTPDEGDYVLREVHEGLCAAHVGSRVLAKKCLLLGYYWPSVFRDTAALVQKCRACQGLKTRLELAQSNWLDELPSVLWAYRTTPRTATQETSFSLTYGTEAVVPTEIGLPSPRIQNFVATANEEELKCNLDLLEAKREEAVIRMAKYKSQLTRYHNARVRSTQYQPGDLVLRKNSVSRAHNSNKLDPNWEGPYKVLETSRAGYCRLARLDGAEIPRTWHFSNLRLFVG
ncbi:uncharacterized protein [Coffea arabica]|uniref:RNase H type-1 domain-containing protein n=1 Tax=Coffea arabica TaxID=13443 RepID=A0ABM4VQB4_COFAR